MNAIRDEMRTMKTVEIRLTTRQLIHLHALTLGTEQTVSNIVTDALVSYDQADGFQAGTVRP